MRLSTRLMAAMVALVVLTAGTVGLLGYRTIEAAVEPRVLAEIHAHVRMLALELEASVRGARADALAFRSAVAVHGIIRTTRAGGTDSGDGMTLQKWRDRLAQRFAAELAAKPNYEQFRIIGIADGGREVLRVDRSGPSRSIRVVPDAELQHKGDRDYFQRAVRLPPGELDVSDVELNQEHGVIETPHLPVLRAAAPLHADDGEPFGIVIINVELRSAFHEIRASAARRGARIFAVNARGDYLLHPDAGREFAFDLGGRSRLEDDFPRLAAALATAGSVEPHIVADRAGVLHGAAAVTVRLGQRTPVTLIETVPYVQITAATSAVRNSTLLAGSLAVLLAAALAGVVTRTLTQPLAQMTHAVEAFGRGLPAAAPVGAGGEIGVLATAFERMRAEVREKTLALEREIGERQRIFESSLDLILVVDGSGRIQRASPAARDILGCAPEALVGREVAALACEDDAERMRARLLGLGTGEPMRDFQCRVRHADGHAVALSWNGVGDGTEQRYFLVGRDLSEHLKLEQQLRHAQRLDAIGQLTGGVAHDFNNILTVITGTIDALAISVKGDPQVAALVKLMDEAAERGAQLTRQLLAFARKQPLQPRDIDVNALVADTMAMLRPTLGEHIEIETHLEETAWHAFVDPGQLAAAILNLAVNARDAMPEGGKLTIETDNVVLDEAYCAAYAEVRPGPYAMIAITDTGCGIPPDIRDKVFEPFFTTKSPGRGTGLGLSMVYGFIKQSGGHIRIYSETGQGTTFRMYLPRPDGRAAEETAELPAAAVEAGGGETILIAEDDAMVRAHVTEQIRSLGYRTLAAAHGEEALAILEREPAVDLLFTDVIMPGGMNGRQLADAARRRRPGLKVLFTSGYTENAVIHHGRLDPGVLLLAKPYRKVELARMIRTALGGKASQVPEEAGPLAAAS